MLIVFYILSVNFHVYLIRLILFIATWEMKKFGFRDVDKLFPRSNIRKFSQNSDSKVGVLPTRLCCLACFWSVSLQGGCNSNQENSGLASGFKDERKEKQAFHELFPWAVWSWKILERDFWNTPLTGIAVPYLTKPELLNLELEKQGFLGHPLGVSTEVCFIQLIICCKQLTVSH